MPIEKIAESSMTLDFVSPSICDSLHKLGITNNVPFFWKLSDSDCTLSTYAFDLDDYYKTADELLILSNIKVTPAYRTSDFEKIFGEYTLCKNGVGQFELCLPNTYKIGCVVANRKPDVFANTIKKILDLRIWPVHYINEQLEANPKV
jgi:hypothetical protein